MYEDAVRLDPGIRALHAFVTVIEEAHFGRAAARLFVTAPALSQQIRRLEQQLGMPLVDGLTLERIAVEPRVVMVHRGHRLAGRESIAIEELDDDLHVSTDRAAPEWIAYWAVDPRPGGKRVRWGPLVHTMEEQLQTVAAGLATAITAASIADHHSGVEVAFVPIHDIEPCAIDLCTRTGDDHPGVLELRRAVAELRAETQTG